MPDAGTSPAEKIYRIYQSLGATRAFDSNKGLGGKLLYSGELDPAGSALLYAANIAGAASIAASTDSAAQRQAIRDGVIDFLVTSLEEALRILKNEIRKQNTVSVGVAVASHQLVGQMLDRGVLPDLLPPPAQELFATQQDQFRVFLSQGAQQLSHHIDGESLNFVTWSADRHFIRWLPQIDQLAQAIIPFEDFARLRWLRLAPRYLGRQAQREHSVGLNESETAQLQAQSKTLVRMNATQDAEIATILVNGEIIS